MSQLGDLAPQEYCRVYDLVRQAGVDVSDWSNYKGGAARAASNPRYCYQWSFTEPGKVVVLCLWYRQLEEREGKIVHDDNLRAYVEELRTSGGSPNWKSRAKKLDEAIHLAFAQSLPVRVVLLAGAMRALQDPQRRPSQVEKRLLDPVEWAVTKIDPDTGACTITRGDPADRYVDQFSLAVGEAGSPTREEVSGTRFVRDRQVRQRVLIRAKGHCELCQAPGFETVSGGVYLETHHIVPLFKEGPDTDSNVVALCPNHHRKAHYGAGKDRLERELLDLIPGKARSRVIAGQNRASPETQD